uniref:TRAP transporter small permease subunit n=1 Tax=Yoonia sp. TaxID=2212373 RepID=UPI00404880BA
MANLKNHKNQAGRVETRSVGRGIRAVGVLERVINSISVIVAWATVVPIALFSILQVLDRKLKLGVSSVLPDMSTSLLFVMIFMLFGFTYLRDGHVRVDVFHRHWSSRTQAKIELIGCLLILLPLSAVLGFYGWEGLMRTTKFADADVWLARSAGMFGPILLGLSGVVVIVRNISFLRGTYDLVTPLEQTGSTAP